MILQAQRAPRPGQGQPSGPGQAEFVICDQSIEVDNWWLKERLGLADFRLRSVEAIAKWHALVFAAYAFLHHWRALPLLTQPSTALAPLIETLAAHRQWHTRQSVCYIASLVRAGYTDDQLLAELFPP
jgi:hypothetical protein